VKGGESLGDKEGSEEEKEVSPTWLSTPEVRPLTSGVFLSKTDHRLRGPQTVKPDG